MTIYYSVSLTLLVIGIILFIVCKYIHKNDKKVPLKHISEDLPILALSHNNKVYNFLVDTGSSFSFISPDYIDDFKIKKMVKEKTSLTTGGGNTSTDSLCTIDFSFNTKTIEVDVRPNDYLSTSFENVERCKGIVLHGILGIDFAKKYINTIDFIKEVIIMKS